MNADPARPSVLILTPDFPPEIGGIQTLVLRIAQGLAHFRPWVVTIATNGSREFDQQQSFKVVRVPASAGHRLGVATVNAFGAVEGLRGRPSVILSAHIITGPAALTVGRLLRRPVVQYAHAQELSRRQGFARQVLSRADAIVADSSYSQTLVERIIGTNGGIHVVHPGVDAPPEPPTPAMSNASIVVVARLAERYKGHDVLLRALVLVREQVPGVHLHVVGDGDLRTELENLSRHLGVADSTTFHGAVSDLQRDSILREGSVLAMPSRLERGGAGEGFGIVYVEAGAHGLPVVAGNAGGAVDAVVDGVTGLLVDPTSPHAVAGALAELLLDKDRARTMGHAGWEHARSLSWAQTAGQVEAVLGEVTAR